MTNIQIILFIYHFTVVSNDELYGHDPKFLDEVNNLCAFVVEEILRRLSLLGNAHQYKLQATLALELLVRIARYADLSKEQIFQLALNLGLLAIKHESQLEPKYIVGHFQLRCNDLFVHIDIYFLASCFEVPRRLL